MQEMDIQFLFLLFKKVASLTFNWTSQIGCINPQSECSGIQDNIKYDFSTLRNNTHDYTIVDLTSKNPYLIRINLCGSLIDYGNPPCLTGAFGCMLWDWPNPLWNETLGLAKTMEVSIIYNTRHQYIGLSLYFTEGALSYGRDMVNSTINLLCDQGSGIGFPSLVTSSNDYFEFSWPTAVVCESDPESIGLININ